MPADAPDDNDGTCKQCGHPFGTHIIAAYDKGDFSKGGEMRCPVEHCQCFSTVSFDPKTFKSERQIGILPKILRRLVQ